MDKWLVQADEQLAAAANHVAPRKERLAKLLKKRLRPNPRGGAQRSHKDADFLDNLATSLDERMRKGTLSEAAVASDLGIGRVALWRNLTDRLGLNYRELERIVQNE